MKAVAAQHKKDIVKKLSKRLAEEKIIGIVNLENLPAAQLQTIKKSLFGKVSMFMTKKRLMKIAIEEVAKKNKDIAKIKDQLEGMPALLFTKDNPFTLFKTLKKSKSPAPAKAGSQIGPAKKPPTLRTWIPAAP